MALVGSCVLDATEQEDMGYVFIVWILNMIAMDLVAFSVMGQEQIIVPHVVAKVIVIVMSVEDGEK